MFGENGQKHCESAPITCELLDVIPLLSDNTMGAACFSMMLSGTYVFPHSGPSNTRLRVHLGLDIPEQPNEKSRDWLTWLRVGDRYMTWKNGEMFVWDDSYDHEVWHYHPLNKTRLVLIFDIWHPELTEFQIASTMLASQYII